RNGSPTRLLKVASVVSSRTISAVPAGTGPLGGLVWATNIVPSRMQTSSSSHFFMEYLPRNPDVLLTLDPARGRNKRQSVHGEPAEIRGQWQWPNGQFRSRKYLANNCVQRHIAFMSIRYNREFQITPWEGTMRVSATLPDAGWRLTATIPTVFMTQWAVKKS